MATTQTTMTTPEALLEMGYTIWERNGMRRIYINDKARWMGLEVNHYNSGNISSARLNGSSISNSYAHKLGRRLSEGKIWFDLTTNTWAGRGFLGTDFATIRDAIEAAVERMRQERN